MTSGRGHIITGTGSARSELNRLLFHKLLLVAICFILVSGFAKGQTLNDYRTTGNVTFASNSNWQRYNGAAWVPAGSAPTSAENIITVRNGHTATVTASISLDQLVVDPGGTLTVNGGRTLTILNGPGTDLIVNGTVINYGTVSPTGTIVFNAGAVYNHSLNGGSIPAANWDPASDCIITGLTNNPTITGFDQVFGNFTWNCPGQTINFYMASDITIAGDFTVSGTGAFDPNNRALRMSNTATGYTMTVNGNIVIENNSTFKMNNGSGSCFVNVGGDVTLNSGNLTIVTGPANSIMSVAGNVSILGGTLGMHEDGSPTVATLDLKGNFTLSGTGTITETSTGSGLIVFSNTSANQTFTRPGGTISNTINFTVNPNVTLAFGASDYVNGGGTFTLSAGATFQTANPSGINGSIQTSSRSLSTSANYTFNGSTAQNTGTYLPASVNNLSINNPAGVSLTNSVSVSNQLSMITGNVSTGSNILTLSPTDPLSLNHTSGTIVGRFLRGVATTGADYLFPVGTASYYRPAVFNFSSLSSSTNITAQFVEASPGTLTPYLDDGTDQLDYAFTDGYWNFSSSSTPGNTYSLSLTGEDFTSFVIDDNSRISARNAGSPDWNDFGTHGSVDIGNSTITRTGLNVLNTTSFDYCFAGRCKTANAGPDVNICKGGSAILNGSGGGTYLWSPAYGLNNPNISNPTASPEVTTTYTLTVTQGLCINTDQVTVTVNQSPSAALGYEYQKTITIDHNQVSGGSDLYNFPVLVTTTDNDLRTVVNGGHVVNSNGYDIIFTDANYIRLDHQVESYDGTSGSLIAWVRIPVLSASSNSVIRMLYGNPQIVADPSSTGTWGPEYSGVWHMDDLSDATINGNDGIDGGSTSAGGIIGNGLQFNGNSLVSIPRSDNLEASNNLTVSMWVRRSGEQNQWAKPLWYGRNDVNPWGPYGFEFNGDSDNSIYFHVTNGTLSGNVLTGTVINNNTWYLLTGTYDGSTVRFYLNDNFVGSTPLAGPIGHYNTIGLTLGNRSTGGQGFTGYIDEVRVSTVTRSADWIMTGYNNMNSPGTFYSFGVETGCSVFSFTDLCSGSPITYSVPNTTGHTYNWIVNGGVPSQTTGNSITVEWGETGPWTIQLQETAGACTGSSIEYSVSVSAQPVARSIIRDPDIPDVCVSAAVSATFSGGSGGVNPVDVYESSIDGGNTWQTYTPGTPLSSAVAGANRIQVRTRRTTTGTGCDNSGWTTVTWNTVAQPAGPTLNTKTPDLVTVCEGQAVSALFNPGTGGVGCSDIFRYRYDGSGSWFAYTPGDDISTAGHNQVEIQGSRSGCTADAGCTETAWITLATWNIVPQPTNPSLNTRIPDLPAVCAGQPVSATFDPGSGGVGCDDAFQYRYDGSGAWLLYTPGTDIVTTGHTLVEIRLQRAGCDENTGCSGTEWIIVTSWNVVQQPAGPSIDTKTPDLAGVCDGETVSATFNPGTGGIGCTDSFRYRFDGTGAWLSYTPGTGINTSGHTLVEIQGQRSGCDAGTGCSGTEWIDLASWIVNPLPVPVINGDNEVCPGTMGVKYSTPGIAGHTYVWVIAGASSYSGENTNEVTVNWAFNCNTTGSVKVTEIITATGCSFTTADYPVTIRDNIDPVWTTIAGSLDATLECSDAAGLAAAQALFPVATDNCDTDVTNIVKSAGSFVPGGICPEAGTYTNTWTVTDACGNISDLFTQVITITDTQAPVWTTATEALDVTLQCSDAAGLTAAQAFFPVASDNCDPDVTDIVKTAGAFIPGGTCPEAGTYTNTWIVTDACGNTSDLYTQVITITDTQAPVWITAPAELNRTVECSDAAGLAAAQALFPVATDNCDPDVTNIVKEPGSFVPGGICTEAGTITNRWRVTDACGNISAYYTQIITITDTQAPVWTTLPGSLDRTLECSDAAGIAAAQALLPVATDNCDSDVSNVVKVSGAFVPGVTCPEAGTFTNTFTVTDACGNTSAVYTQVITLTDTQVPVWINAPNELDRTVECSDAAGITAAQALFPLASDNCDTDVTNIVKISGAFVPGGSCPEAGTYTNTWTVTDACGNISGIYTQVITIIDTEAPVWTTPANSLDRTVQCSDAAGLADAQALFPAATDNCDTDVTNIVKTAGAFVPIDNPYQGTYTNTWTITDNCGNVSDLFIQVITVIDNTPPVIICPADITVNCEDDSSPAGTGSATATDNCTPVDDIVVSFVDASGYDADPSSINHYNYTITRTWIATDLTGNFSECIQTITVQDVTLPVITCPADVTISCEDDNTPAGTGTATATDNCALPANIAITWSDFSTYNADPSNVNHYNYVITRTWRATDVAGNFSECIQTITVQDVTDPDFTVPATVTICRAADCTYDADPSATGDVTDESDNCTPVALLDAVYADDPSGMIDCNTAGFITRTWTLADISGNTTTKIQIIWVEPTPTATIVNNTPLICDSTSVNLVFDSPTVSTNPDDQSFEIVVTSSDPVNLTGSASVGFTITRAQMPYLLDGTLINNSDSPVQVTYTVNSNLTGCSEFVPVSSTVWVNPTPRIFPVMTNLIQCDSTTTNITLQSPSTFTSGFVTFNLSATAPAGLSGYTPLAPGLANGHVITDNLINTTDGPLAVTYTITPVSPTGCNNGPSQTFTVTVNPTPRIFPVPLSSTQCDSTATNIVLQSPSTFTSGEISFKYNVTATGGVTGFTTPVSGLPNNHIIADELVNPTDEPQTVTYVITPVSPVGCNDGPSQVVTITVNPTPRIFPVLTDLIQCDSTTTNITLQSPSTFTGGDVTLNLSATAPAGLSGYTPLASGLANGHVITDNLINTTDGPLAVTYTITPVSPVGCNNGPSQTFTVTVNPTPRIFPVPLSSTQCDSTATNIVLQSPSTFTSGEISFKYNVTATGDRKSVV